MSKNKLGDHVPVSIENLHKTYPGKKGKRVKAVSDLSLSVMRGEILGILGPNGAGKSTTIKILTGQLQADQGTVRLFGALPDVAATRLKVGYLPENPSFYEFLTPRELLGFVGGTYGLQGIDLQNAISRVLSLLDLEGASTRLIRQFSKGMVQRLGLAQALLHDPDLYIFDEPMSGLDPMGRALVKQFITELRGRGKTVLFSTHVTADVEAVCDRVAIIVDGQLQAFNSVSEVLKEGIDGYTIQLSNVSEDLLAGTQWRKYADNIVEVYVDRSSLNFFLTKAASEGATIQLMEPVRRNLEQFFLEIVQRNTC